MSLTRRARTAAERLLLANAKPVRRLLLATGGAVAASGPDENGVGRAIDRPCAAFDFDGGFAAMAFAAISARPSANAVIAHKTMAARCFSILGFTVDSSRDSAAAS